MAQYGVLTKKETRNAKTTGKPYVLAGVDDGDFISFGKTVGNYDRLTVGDKVEYTAAPPEKEGGTPVIIFIKKAGDGATTTTTSAATPTTTAAPRTTADPTLRDRSILWQVSYKMATELVAALGATDGIEAVKRVSALAKELHLSLTRDIEGFDPTKEDANRPS